MDILSDTQVVILAGGKGTRMKCDTPKCLTMLGSMSFLERVIQACSFITKKPVIVVGYKGDEVINAIGKNNADFVWQREQLGTGHAVSMAKDSESVQGCKHIIVLMGDQPFISSQTLRELVATHKENNATVTITTARVPHFENEFAPFVRFGRVIRNQHNLVGSIVEYKDATPEIQLVREVNIGTYVFNAEFLWSHIDTLSNTNASDEYYITDLVHMAFEEQKKVVPYVLSKTTEALGINSFEDLEIAKKYM